MLTRARTALASPDALEHVLVLVAATTWILLVTRASGGFHDPRTALLAAATLPASLVTRPWRHVSWWLSALPVTAAVGGLVVLMTTRTGWMQADSVADQVLAPVALVTVAAYARTPRRRAFIALVLTCALGVTSLLALEPWFGGGDPNKLITDPFGWHNQTAVFLGALGLVVGAPAVLAPQARSRWLKLLLTALAGAIVVLTTSRTSLGLLLLGWLVVCAFALTGQGRWKALARWCAVPALSAGLVLTMTSGLFFARDWAGPPLLGGGTVATAQVTGPRDAGTTESNGSDRVVWSKAALHSFAQHPVEGDGFGSFLATSDPQLAPGRIRSTFVHDGFAEALTSGGLLFGVPVLFSAAVIGLSALRVLRRGEQRPLLLGFALGAAVLLLHSGADFDAHYASLQVLLGVLGGVLLAANERPVQGTSTRQAVVAGGLVLSLVTVALATVVEHHGRVVSHSGASAAHLLDAEWPGLRDPRIEGAALAACLDGAGSLAVPPSVARRAVDTSAEAAGLLPDIRALRAKVIMALD